MKNISRLGIAPRDSLPAGTPIVPSYRRPGRLVGMDLCQHFAKSVVTRLRRGARFCGKIEVCRNDFMGNRTTLEAERPAKPQKARKNPPAGTGAAKAGSRERERIFD